MNAGTETIISLEKRFWDSMAREQTDEALGMLANPSFMVSPQGAMKFDHQTYRQMAEHGDQVIKRYELGEMDATFFGDATAILNYTVKQTVCPRGKTGEETEQQMNDTSTWVKVDGQWRCVMHTETPVNRR